MANSFDPEQPDLGLHGVQTCLYEYLRSLQYFSDVIK